MSTAGKTLLILGGMLMVGAIAWWYMFFEQVLGENVKRASECFYFTTESCAVGNMLGLVSDIPAYSPVAFWAASATLIVGIVLIAVAPRDR